MIPIIGEAADLTLCGWDLQDHQWVDAGFDCAAIIPFLGTAPRAARWGDRAIDAADTTHDLQRAPRAARLCSFSAATEVLMADGTTKPISDVEVGDFVLAEDPESGERGPREVTHLWVHQDTIVDLKIDGRDVATTEDHPFWNHTDGEWQRADALDHGDLLLSAHGDLLEAGGLDLGSARTTTAYNLTVDDIHTYFVVAGDEEVLVHNTCPNPGNLKKLTTSQIEDAVGTSVHQFKYDILGEGAQISRFDVFREGDIIYLVEKSTGNIVETGYRIPGAG